MLHLLNNLNLRLNLNFFSEKDFKPLLGGVTYGADNKTIIKARFVLFPRANLLDQGKETKFFLIRTQVT